MATITQSIAAFNDGQVRIEIDWNDANRRWSRGRIFNNSAQPVYLQILRAGSEVFSLTVDGGKAAEHNLPAGLVYQWLDDGDGLGFNISLGDIVARARWPA